MIVSEAAWAGFALRAGVHEGRTDVPWVGSGGGLPILATRDSSGSGGSRAISSVFHGAFSDLERVFKGEFVLEDA